MIEKRRERADDEERARTARLQGRRIRVLLVEDYAAYACLIRELLAEAAGPSLEIAHAERLGEAIARLATEAFDVVLLDLGLPDGRGPENVRRVRAAAPRASIVVLTGREDEVSAIDAIRAGAGAYLIKGDIDGETVLQAIRAVRTAEDPEAQGESSASGPAPAPAPALAPPPAPSHPFAAASFYRAPRGSGELPRAGGPRAEARRLEDLGRLARCLARELDDLLATVVGYAELIDTGLAAADPTRADAQKVLEAGRRAAAITRQLLSTTERSEETAS